MELRPVTDLRIHPAARDLHLLSEEHPAFVALVDNMLDVGFNPAHPITITNDGRILDGRHRWRAAKRAGLAAVPCIIRDESEAATIIIGSIVARKHYTKSALAFEVYPLMQAAHEEAIHRATERIKHGPKSTPVSARTRDLNTSLGISKNMLAMAKQVHDIFRQDPEYAAEMLPRLYQEPSGGEAQESTRPVGLGAIIAGHAGKQRTDSVSRDHWEQQMDLFGETWSTLKRATKYWTKLDPRRQEAVVGQFRTVAAAMPQDLRSALIETLTSIQD